MSIDGTDQSAPRPLPSLAPPAVPPGAVTDEERNRYGMLLDSAAERGLLSSGEYQARLGELAEATSVDELHRIVTELPAFGAAGARPASPSVRGRSGTSRTGPVADPAALDSALWANLTPAKKGTGSGSPWLVLAVIVLVVIVAFVALALVAAHVAHAHHTGVPAPGAVLSRLRP